LNPIISKIGQHVVLLLFDYVASQLLGVAQAITRRVPRENSLHFHKINPLWTKLVQSRWLNIVIVLFLDFLGPDWLRQTVLYFLNWTVCLFLKEILFETIQINP